MVGFGVSVRIDGVGGAVSGMGGAVGLGSEDEAVALGCHFLRSTEGVAGVIDELVSAGLTSTMGVGAAVASVVMGWSSSVVEDLLSMTGAVKPLVFRTPSRRSWHAPRTRPRPPRKPRLARSRTPRRMPARKRSSSSNSRASTSTTKSSSAISAAPSPRAVRCTRRFRSTPPTARGRPRSVIRGSSPLFVYRKIYVAHKDSETYVVKR